MNSLPYFMRFHLKIFQILGYFPISLNKKLEYISRNETILRFWSLLLLSIFSSIAIYVFFGNDEYLTDMDAFSYFNDCLQFGFAHIAMATTYVETLLKHKNLRKFWNCYLSLNNKRNGRKFLWPFESFSVEILKNFTFFLTFYILTICDIGALITFACIENMTRQLILFWAMFSPFSIFNHLRVKMFIFHLEILRLELKQLQKDLSLLADYTKFATKVHPFDGFEEFLRRKLLEKQKTYQCIYDMYIYFQNSFGYSILATLLFIYVRVVVDAYFIYYYAYCNRNRYEALLLMSACFEIPAFLFISKNCMNVVQHITFQLHSIISPLDDKILSAQIQNFSLQILHQQIKINGVGIGTMDGYMLTRAIGSITTYMVFFIQLMPKFGQSDIGPNSPNNRTN